MRPAFCLLVFLCLLLSPLTAQDDWVCPPCSGDCDQLVFAEPGECPHCRMDLITRQMRDNMNLTIAFYLQDGVEVLDFAGPMEVFSYAGFRVYTVSLTKEPITSQGILTVLPDYSLQEAPPADILAFFGGNGLNTARTPELIEWVKSRRNIDYYFSVCTGAFILGEAGLLDGQTVTTFHRAIDDLKRMYPAAHVRSDVRFVDNGRVITTAGISAGIDGALHLVQKILGREKAADIARQMEYDKWQPDEGLVTEAAADYQPLQDH